MDLQRAAEALRALAQETRLEVFRLLVQNSPEGMPAGAIMEALGVPAPTLSFHLQQLNHAGLVTKRRASRQLIYSVNVEGMNRLMSYLTENCCAGRPELCAPATGCSNKSACAEPPPPRKRAKIRKTA